MLQGDGVGALGFYARAVGRTTYWGAFPAIAPTLGQAVEQALSICREQAKRPEACGGRLTFCAGGSRQGYAVGGRAADLAGDRGSGA